ncbi:MAG: YceI family protein [Mucilaginibacter sp.]
MKKIFAFLTIAALTVSTVIAQSTWKVDKAHARLQFTITHLAISDVDGFFKDFDVTIVSAKPDFSDAKITLVVQTASVNTDNNKRDTHLKSDEFFDVTKYPTMNFVSTSVTPTSAGHFKLVGNLTLHGVTKPVTMDLWHRATIVNPQTQKESAGFKVTGSIKRSDFNFGRGFRSPILGDEVTITANGEFGKAN